jgi:hypothetical protein
MSAEILTPPVLAPVYDPIITSDPQLSPEMEIWKTSKRPSSASYRKS